MCSIFLVDLALFQFLLKYLYLFVLLWNNTFLFAQSQFKIFLKFGVWVSDLVAFVFLAWLGDLEVWVDGIFTWISVGHLYFFAVSDRWCIWLGCFLFQKELTHSQVVDRVHIWVDLCSVYTFRNSLWLIHHLVDVNVWLFLLLLSQIDLYLLRHLLIFVTRLLNILWCLLIFVLPLWHYSSITRYQINKVKQFISVVLLDFTHFAQFHIHFIVGPFSDLNFTLVLRDFDDLLLAESNDIPEHLDFIHQVRFC